MVSQMTNTDKTTRPTAYQSISTAPYTRQPEKTGDFNTQRNQIQKGVAL